MISTYDDLFERIYHRGTEEAKKIIVTGDG